MRRTFTRTAITAAAVAVMAASTQVDALTLGEIDVTSQLNQRFTATIPLAEITGEDLETVTVSLAPNEAYEKAGIERPEYLSSLSFDIASNKGRPKVVITSGQIAREPVLNLLVQARWKGGKILRDYVVLLDPPVMPVPKPAAAPVAPPVVAPAPRSGAAPIIATPPTPIAPAAPTKPPSEFFETADEARKPARGAAGKPVTAPALAGDGNFDSATNSYGPVAPQQTLWNIATKVRPSAAVSMDQVMLALAEANPEAIQRGITVSKGATLRVPSAERMQAVSPAAAKTRLAALRGGAPSEAGPAKAAKPAAKPATSEAAPAKPSVSAAAPAASAAATAASAPSAAPPASPAGTTAKPAAPASTAPVIAQTPSTKPAPATTTSATPASGTAPAASAPSSATPATSAAPASAAPTTAPAVPTPTPAAPAAPAASKPATPPPSATQPAPVEDDGLLSSLGLPALLLALLAVVVGAFFALRKRAAGRKNPGEAVFKPSNTAALSPAAAAAVSSAAAARLGDHPRSSGDTQIIRAAPSAQSTQQMTQPVAAPRPDPMATLILDPETSTAMRSSVQPSAVTHGPNAEKASQLHVDTMQIALQKDDPISEADFHLAYGLYDEAIVLLKQASAKAPQRDDIKVKLAETYFAAGKALEFQELAETLHGQLPAAEWSKLAIMGQQICPDAPLFKSAGAGSLDADFDLGLDDVDLPAGESMPVKGAAERPEPMSMVSIVPEPLSLSLDESHLSTGELKLPEISAPSPAPAPTPAAAKKATPLNPGILDTSIEDPGSIDFMLGQSLTPLGAGSIGGSQKPDVPLMDFKPDLDASPLNMPTSKLSLDELPPLSDGPTITPRNANLVDFSLQDLEVSITPREGAGASESDVNTKLDLARAYVEMGDNEMARSLLQEVETVGNDQQKREAASLLQRLGKA